MLLAPLSAGVGKSRGKALCNVVVVMVACKRNALLKLPEKFGKLFYKRLAVLCLVGVLKVGCPRELNCVLAGSERKSALFIN